MLPRRAADLFFSGAHENFYVRRPGAGQILHMIEAGSCKRVVKLRLRTRDLCGPRKVTMAVEA